MKLKTTISFWILCAITILLGAVAAQAGWVMDEQNGNKIVISQGMMKSSWEHGSVIVDSEKGMIYFIDDRQKMIASGTPDELCEQLSKMIDSTMQQLPPQQREMMKKMMKGSTGKVQVTKKGPGEEISGLQTTRYEVSQDGKIKEELWLSSDDALVKECAAVQKILFQFTACTASARSMLTASFRSSPEYLGLFQSGVLVKSIDHDENSKTVGSLTLSPKNVPADAFALPSGYNEVPVTQLYGME